ncbi:T9SS type A sorting domain-containing protein [Aurantibacter sp.]|uniref:T9SS type A sorting domain-containing protein n=1 Tax=Aurantibacter sp. TaxID=2807103 RepID=UPI0035C7B98B
MKQKLLFSILFFSMIFLASAQNKREVADKWLIDNYSELLINQEHQLEMLFSRPALSGETFRYYQMINNVQVFDAEITVHVSNKNKVSYFASSYKKAVQNINTNPSVTGPEAFQIALNELNIQTSDVIQSENKLYIFHKDDITTLVRRVYIYGYSKTGAWEIIVDAQNGTVISSRDVAVYHKPNHQKDKPKKKKEEKENISSVSTTGIGFIFDTDPLTATTSSYGGQYVDGNDATNATLDAARTFVTLPDIDLNGGNYTLKSNYVEIAELDSPNKGLFIQNSDDFSFNRQEDGFEAVNVFYHVDKSMRYINTDLGIVLTPPQNGGVVRFDPHGAGGADNSYYTGGTLVFGEGCVDDGEDADVILHELGHGLHDWITNGGLSQVNGLSEGCGDYWANSYKRSLGLWGSGDAARNYVFGWDGHNVCWNGRSTIYGAQYPGGLVGGGPHTDGQIWASVMMEIWEIVGRTKTDKAFLNGLGMTNSGTNQEQAAIAVRQAAIDMGTNHGYTCADIQAFTDRFTARGYTMPAYTCTLSVADFDTNTISIFPNPASTGITFKNIKVQTEIIVFNMLGQTVATKTISSNNNTLNVNALTTGTYFIKIKGSNKVLKFIKE